MKLRFFLFTAIVLVMVATLLDTADAKRAKKPPKRPATTKNPKRQSPSKVEDVGKYLIGKFYCPKPKTIQCKCVYCPICPPPPPRPLSRQEDSSSEEEKVEVASFSPRCPANYDAVCNCISDEEGESEEDIKKKPRPSKGRAVSYESGSGSGSSSSSASGSRSASGSGSWESRSSSGSYSAESISVEPQQKWRPPNTFRWSPNRRDGYASQGRLPQHRPYKPSSSYRGRRRPPVRQIVEPGRLPEKPPTQPRENPSSGGLGKTKPATEYIQGLVVDLSDEFVPKVCSKVRCPTFRPLKLKALRYREQTVAGKIYFVEVKVENKYFHAKILEVPWQGVVELLHVHGPKKPNELIKYF